jgi:hypothetical protein
MRSICAKTAILAGVDSKSPSGWQQIAPFIADAIDHALRNLSAGRFRSRTKMQGHALDSFRLHCQYLSFTDC